MASLRLTFPEKDQPTVIALTGARLTIGRLPFNTIQIIDRTVSGFHAELIGEHGHYRLHDRGSSNGTYVNGQKVSDYHLNEACTISFGTVEAQFSPEEVAAVEEAETFPSRGEVNAVRQENAEMRATVSALREEIAALRKEHTGSTEGGAAGVSREEFDQVAAEREALKEAQLRHEEEINRLKTDLAILKRDRLNLQLAYDGAQRELEQLRRKVNGADEAPALAPVEAAAVVAAQADEVRIEVPKRPVPMTPPSVPETEAAAPMMPLSVPESSPAEEATPAAPDSPEPLAPAASLPFKPMPKPLVPLSKAPSAVPAPAVSGQPAKPPASVTLPHKPGAPSGESGYGGDRHRQGARGARQWRPPIFAPADRAGQTRHPSTGNWKAPAAGGEAAATVYRETESRPTPQDRPQRHAENRGIGLGVSRASAVGIRAVFGLKSSVLPILRLPTPAPMSAASMSEEESIPRREKRVAGLLLLLALGLRCFYIFRYRYDSDEPQHLHTTWGWTQGLLQYRDFFDNHTPLFHILFSPLVAALGERTNILDFMRFAIVPLWFVSLWCVWKIGCALFSRRAGCWAVVLISLLPWWFYPALEYRTDNLWTPLWLGAVATLVCGRFTRGRAFTGGLLLGICFTASLKTVLLTFVLVMALGGTLLICVRRLGLAGIVRVLRTSWPVLVGMIVAPAILASFFALKGAWKPFIYGTIQHQLLPDVDKVNHPLYLRLVFPVALPFLLGAAAWIVHRAPDTARAVRRAGLFLVAGFYYTGLYTFWTLLTRQDYLPFFPLAMVLLAPALIALTERFVAAQPARGLVAVGALEIVLILAGRPPWVDGTQREREILGEVLRLTKPGEFVMDFKGESVFRRRAFFYVLEPLTHVRIRSMIIADTVAEDLVDKHVCVVLNQDRWYPRNAVKFMAENYLAVGRMRVAGKVIAAKPVAANETIRFAVAVPASYVFWADGGPITGSLDGTPPTEARELTAGPHAFAPDAPHGPVAIFWSRAADLKFQPVLDKVGWQDFK